MANHDLKRKVAAAGKVSPKVGADAGPQTKANPDPYLVKGRT
jgi:hypothetical protein